MGETREEEILKRHVKDLAQKSYRQNVYTFSGFLSEADQDALFCIQKDLSYISWTLFGGSEDAERKIVRFGSEQDLGYEEAWPICLLKIEPLLKKFADDLSHRDFLGALMNLGIDRSTLGDIYVQENVGYVWCLQSIADYIKESLDQVKHTNVRVVDADPLTELKAQEPQEEEVLVSSSRIDGVISHLYHLSRSESIELFRTQKVRVNGRACENNSYMLKASDGVSVRGYGKFTYEGLQGETRKGKERVRLLVYRAGK
ncbi:MAG: hypothetical protein K6G23_05915 [Lachnospiraceae bacterium]|nr:hypothetical protein [Lachnospiraceae bacterium]